jgi:hypothetical protein
MLRKAQQIALRSCDNNNNNPLIHLRKIEQATAKIQVVRPRRKKSGQTSMRLCALARARPFIIK